MGTQLRMVSGTGVIWVASHETEVDWTGECGKTKSTGVSRRVQWKKRIVDTEK